MRHLPNLLTLANLFFGCCALLYTLHGQPVTAAFFTLGSFICDYADGMLARALKVSSPLGKELDSLADVVSFGVVPGAMLYMLLSQSAMNCHLEGAADFPLVPAALPAFILSAFSGLRLGRFNLDTRQTSYFIGLSTPACTVLVLGLVLSAHHDRFGLAEYIRSPWLLYPLIGVLSWLLNAEIPMYGLKIKRLDLRSNLLMLGFAALLIVSALWLKELSLTLIVLLYILASLFSRERVVASAGQA
ncbi:MAG TPA: CDP-alcohol phosphatidyltransferase family protein [Saprospiraceae bacterium]|nr:CDP-alcohol phosphatidyltransferase family protein [Saprospiraceae bacterium]HND87100.1 CDP-alcohol phosphatidyltransferase family protein [Saprospiraceae bacterium]